MSSKRLLELQEEARKTSQRIAEFEAEERKATEVNRPMIEAALHFLRERSTRIGQHIRQLGGSE